MQVVVTAADMKAQFIQAPGFTRETVVVQMCSTQTWLKYLWWDKPGIWLYGEMYKKHPVCNNAA